MATYKPRKIQFRETYTIDGWNLKIYTIAKQGDFDYSDFYENVKSELPTWLKLKNGFNDQHNHVGFLILHAGKEGIFSLINWWVDYYMLSTNIFLTKYDNFKEFEKISGHGLSPCVWEFEVINHERLSWTDNVLKKLPHPDFESYLETTINKIL